jgi:signal transduction histidine kinase
MKHTEIIYVFDKDKTRIKRLTEALGERYEILVVNKPESLPEEHEHAACIVVDPEIDETLATSAIDLIKIKRLPIFVWAPIGKPPSAWEYTLPVQVLQSPPSVRSITEKMIPILEGDKQRLIILATSDDRMTSQVASRLIDKGYEVKRALDRTRLEEHLHYNRDEIALIFVDLSLAQGLMERNEIGPPIPVMVNVPGGLGSSIGPVKLEPMLTLVTAGLSPEAISNTIQDVIIEGEREILRDATVQIAHKESAQSGRMTNRLIDLLLKATKKQIEETRAEEFNILNARTMGLIDEFFICLSKALDSCRILIETLETPELEEELFEINKKLAQGQEILDALTTVDWYRSSSAPEPLPIRKLLSDAVGLIKTNRRRKEIEWVLNTNQIGTTIASKDQMVEAVVNICVNSYEAIEETGKIEITTSFDTQWNYIEILDNGTGIPPEVIPFITKPFFTTKKSTHKGLGLTVAKGIIETHGGKIDIEPNAKGTLVKITLPRIRESKNLIENSENPDVMLVAPKKSLGFLQSMLTQHGFAVVPYDNISDFIHAAKRITPQIIIVQAGLEYMDVAGLRMLSNVKGDAKFILLDPQEKIKEEVRGVDLAIRGTYPSHHLIAIITSFIKDVSPPTAVVAQI